MSGPQSKSVEDTAPALSLTWGAKSIAKEIFGEASPKARRRVEHLARTKKFPGLVRVGRRLVLNKRVAQLVGAGEG